MRSAVSYPRLLAILFCAAAALISYKLLAKHMTGSSGSAWFESGCTPDDEQRGPNCAAVLASPHSYWPPKRTDEPRGRPHIPVAFLGLVYFSALGVWVAGVGGPSRSRRWIHLIPLGCVLAGLLASARFMYIMFTVLEEWCPWCVATHVLNLCIAICLLLLWPRAGRAASRAGPQTSDASTEPSSAATAVTAPSTAPIRSDSHPSRGRVFGTIGVVLIVLYGNYGQLGLLTVRKAESTLRQCMAAVSRIKADTSKLVRNWRLATTRDIPLRADDPARTQAKRGEKILEVVVFSDLQCPSCARLAPFLDESVQLMFDGHLRIVFKHYPLDTECNPHVRRTLHAQACLAATIAEAARLQGGSDAFWRAHDFLFARRHAVDSPTRYDPVDIAEHLDLDAARLQEDMASPAVMARIQEDIDLAHRCEVVGTPAVFVGKRRVDALALTELAFWDQVANMFWKDRGRPRPESTLLENLRTTRDTQGRRGAP